MMRRPCDQRKHLQGSDQHPTGQLNFFDASEMHVEDEAFWTDNREGFNHDPGPRPDISRRVPLQNQRSAEPTVTTLGRNGGLRRQSDGVATYDATKIEARRDEEPANLPSEAEGRLPGEPAMVDPVMERGQQMWVDQFEKGGLQLGLESMNL